MSGEECILSQITDERNGPQYNADCHLQHTEFHSWGNGNCPVRNMNCDQNDKESVFKTKTPPPIKSYLGNLFPTGLISECGQLAFMQLKKKKINKQWHILKSSLILNAIYQQYLSLAIQNTYNPWFVVFTCIFFHWIRQNDWYYCHTSYDNK